MKAIHFVGSLRYLTQNAVVVAAGVRERGGCGLCRGSQLRGKRWDGQWTPAWYASCTAPEYDRVAKVPNVLTLLVVGRNAGFKVDLRPAIDPK